MSYMGFSREAFPALTHIVVPSDVPQVIMGPFRLTWFQLIIASDSLFDGDVVFEYLDVVGVWEGICDVSSSDNFAKADAVSQLNPGGGVWGASSGNSRPDANASGQVFVRVRIATKATNGSCTIRLRYLT